MPTMRITITSARELGVVLWMASQTKGGHAMDLDIASEIRLFFVHDKAPHAADLDFDSILQSFADSGFHLTAEVAAPIRKKVKKGSGDRRKSASR